MINCPCPSACCTVLTTASPRHLHLHNAPVSGDHIVDHRVKVRVLEVFLEPNAVVRASAVVVVSVGGEDWYEDFGKRRKHVHGEDCLHAGTMMGLTLLGLVTEGVRTGIP